MSDTHIIGNMGSVWENLGSHGAYNSPKLHRLTKPTFKTVAGPSRPKVHPSANVKTAFAFGSV